MNTSYTSDDFTGNPTSMIVSGVSYMYEEPKKGIRENIKILKRRKDDMIHDLDDSEVEILDSVVATLRSLKGTEVEYEDIQSEVVKNFKNCSMKQGTVGALFMKCFNKNGKGVVGCTSECSMEGTKSGKETCTDMILLYEDGKLMKLYDVESKHAYVHVKDRKMKHPDQKFIEGVRKVGVNSFTLVFFDKSGENVKDEKYYNIDEFKKDVYEKEVKKGHGTKDGTKNEQGDDVTKTSSSNITLLIILIIVLVALVCIAAYIYVNNPSSLDFSKSIGEFTF